MPDQRTIGNAQRTFGDHLPILAAARIIPPWTQAKMDASTLARTPSLVCPPAHLSCVPSGVTRRTQDLRGQKRQCLPSA